MDQTAREYKGEYRGKKILVIGSGSDLDGRRMHDEIESNKYDIVARVNKLYGANEDVGTRTDVIFTRWYSWLDNLQWFNKDVQDNAKQIVILNQHVGYSQTEYQWLCAKMGTTSASAGAQAIDFFLNRGAACVDVIGFGCKEGKFNPDKIYTQGSKGTTPEHNTTKEGKDENPNYDWHAEREWEINQASVKFI